MCQTRGQNWSKTLNHAKNSISIPFSLNYIVPHKAVKFWKNVLMSTIIYLVACKKKWTFSFSTVPVVWTVEGGTWQTELKTRGLWRPLHGCCQTQRTKGDTHLNNTQLTHYSLRGATEASDMTPRTPEWSKTQKGVPVNLKELCKPSRRVFVRMVYAGQLQLSAFKRSEDQQTLYFIVFLY